MSKNHIKAAVVIGLALVALSSPSGEASGAGSNNSAGLCNTWLPFSQCSDDIAIGIACTGLCPEWIVAVCDPEQGLACFAAKVE